MAQITARSVGHAITQWECVKSGLLDGSVRTDGEVVSRKKYVARKLGEEWHNDCVFCEAVSIRSGNYMRLTNCERCFLYAKTKTPCSDKTSVYAVACMADNPVGMRVAACDKMIEILSLYARELEEEA